jgi:hypothetical protein
MIYETINGWRIMPILENEVSDYKWEAEKNGFAQRFTNKDSARDFARRTPGKGY